MLNDMYSLSIDNVRIGFIMNYGSFLQESSTTDSKPFHSHGYYEILISFDDRNTLILSKGKVSLPKNTATIVAAKCLHATHSVHSLSLASICFFYERQEASTIRYDLFSIFDNMFADEDADYLQGIADEGICDLLSQLKGFSVQNDPISDGITISALTQLLFNVFADIHNGRDKSFIIEKTPKKQLIHSRLNILRLADERLTSDFNTKISPEMLAADLFISSRQLNRYFREQYGMTISQRRTMLRMELAKKLLLQTNAPLAEIAEEVGYHSEKTFYSAFRAYYHTSPTAFRTAQKSLS